mmetsp:Transcript_146277/g.253262  ORF Transcript_146277/g.253262 Transcript_146277/m.253262 type:complete len:570 (+) Transcript_146277:59-1768(+)
MGLTVYCLRLLTALCAAACAADTGREQHCRVSAEQQQQQRGVISSALLQREAKSASEAHSALSAHLDLGAAPTLLASPPKEDLALTNAVLHSPPKETHDPSSELVKPPHGHDEKSMSTALAMTIIGIVLTIAGFLYLLNWPFKAMRRASWKVLSETLTIFCAVLFFDAYFKISRIFDWERQGPGGHEEPAHETPFVPGQRLIYANFARFLLAFLVFEGCLLWSRTHSWWTEPFGFVGSHVVGFSIISFFGDLQQAEPWRGSPFMAFLLTIVATVLVVTLFYAAAHVRELVCEACKGKPHEMKAMTAWCHLACEFEDDAAGLALGLLITQVIKFQITGTLPPVHGAPKNKTRRQVYMLFCSAIFFTLLVGATARWLHGVRRNVRLSHRMRRTGAMVLQISSMTTGWCVLYWGMWNFWTTTGNEGVGEGDVISARLVLVGFFAVGGFGIIWILNHLTHQGLVNVDAQRSLIDAIGLMLGLSWESCVNVAMEGIHYGVEDTQFRLINGMVDFTLAVIVTPAWALYILPHAMAHMKAEEEGEAEHEDTKEVKHGGEHHEDDEEEETACCCPVG